jgi:hypothetical protein
VIDSDNSAKQNGHENSHSKDMHKHRNFAQFRRAWLYKALRCANKNADLIRNCRVFRGFLVRKNIGEKNERHSCDAIQILF